MIELTHNFRPDAFMWLWAKYVRAANARYHCTNSLVGRYSRTFNKSNPLLSAAAGLVLDEEPVHSYAAVYICGVIKNRYSTKQNYPHNVHAAIKVSPGSSDEWRFEEWHMRVHHGIFLPIPQSVTDIPPKYQSLPSEFTSCRIFRWAVQYFETSSAGSPNRTQESERL